MTGDNLQEEDNKGFRHLSPDRPAVEFSNLSRARVMIRVPNWVGDAVMAVPALCELRRIFAGAHITLVARPWVAGLFDGEGLADDLIPVTDSSGLTQKTASFMSLVRRLRRERFQIAVLLQNAFGAALVAQAAGIKKIVGYPTDGRRALLDISIPFEPEHKTLHQVRYYLNLARELERKLTGTSAIEIQKLEPVLHASERDRARVQTMFDDLGIKRGQPVAALNPGATNSRAKQWLPERFAAVADRFVHNDGLQAIIVGAASDIEAANEVARHMRSRATVLAGKTSISEFKAVLAASSVVVSNDTGASHVAAALGVPTVVVFGPTEHVSTRPLSPLALVVRKPVECSPCMLKDCPIDHRCMTGVEVDDVYLAAQRISH